MPKKTPVKSKTKKTITETPAELLVKPLELQKEKFRWISFEVLSFVVAIAGLITAVYSIGEAKKANQIALEANQIAKDALLPQIVISYLYPVNQSHDDILRAPCIEKYTNDVVWTSEFASVFDITNIGNKTISLTNMSYQRETPTNNGNINALTEFNFFASRTEFEQWFVSRDSSPFTQNVLQSLENSTIVGPPINIESGETRRLIIRGNVRAYINPSFTINEVYRATRLDPSWGTKISFIFGDGTTQDVSVYVPRPYDGVVPDMYGEYQSCPG